MIGLVAQHPVRTETTSTQTYLDSCRAMLVEYRYLNGPTTVTLSSITLMVDNLCHAFAGGLVQDTDKTRAAARSVCDRVTDFVEEWKEKRSVGKEVIHERRT